MRCTASTPEAYDFFHDACLALMDVEEHGMLVDVEYCKQQREYLINKVRECRKAILASPEGQKWRQRYGQSMNLNSDDQLKVVLYEMCGHKPPDGKTSVNAATLQALKVPMVTDLLNMRKYEKAEGTYLAPFIREQTDDVLHCFFHLHRVVSYRSSSSSVNFQNIPIRDPEIGPLCRNAIKARPGRKIAELDYSGAEVGAAYCYHKDPAMGKYLFDPATDMHRDAICDCFMLEPDQVWKGIRHLGKNDFVFPQFYGDYYVQCAKSLWADAANVKLDKAEAATCRDWLYTRGFKKYADFEQHIKEVEDVFWNKRFKVYAKWRQDHIAAYHKRGYVDGLSGFRYSGIMSRTEVINYPVQGFAFHWLLWSLIQLNRELKQQHFTTRIMGQIHDSMVLDLDPDEEDAVLYLANDIMTHRVKEHWPSIIAPLEVEAELTPVDGTWAQKSLRPMPDHC